MNAPRDRLANQTKLGQLGSSGGRCPPRQVDLNLYHLGHLSSRALVLLELDVHRASHSH